MSSLVGFWLMTGGMGVMTIALTAAGIVQIYLERVLGVPFAEAQSYMTLWYQIRFIGGAAMIAGIVLFLADVFALRRETVTAPLPGKIMEALS